jgi:hypothetical protein
LPEPPRNISGLWMGSFSYPSELGPTTPFLARIVDEDGRLSGDIVEPNTVGATSEQLQSFLSGTRQGASIDFVKAYDGSSDAAHAVDYVGRMSGDGMSITGVWSLADLDGPFEMFREAVWEEVTGVEAVVEPLSAGKLAGTPTNFVRPELVEGSASSLPAEREEKRWPSTGSGRTVLN